MPDPTTLRALAARSQSGPLYPALNEEIARALGWEPRFQVAEIYWAAPGEADHLTTWYVALPDWLNDLNAAILLVPHDCTWSVAKHGEQEFEANVTLPAVGPEALRPGYTVIAATAAAALTGAALLARSE